MLTRAVAFCIAMTPLIAIGSDYDEILQNALAELNNDYLNNWMFNEERIFDGVLTEAQYDPRLKDKWQLQSIQGMSPTLEERKKFVQEKIKETKSAAKQEQRRDLKSLVSLKTLKLVEESEEHWLFDFVPDREGDEGQFMALLHGELKISKQSLAIEYIDLRNEDIIKPRFGFRVDEFFSRIEFMRIKRSGPVVPSSIEFRIKAKALGMVNVDEKIVLKYRNYQIVEEAY
ncbi:MAG: hypothetical protein CBB61_000105 [Gammaproteobacteria bacterium TMED1]|nr:MAG: hypothetical protein CBB61_000105 [Gammaproteobacteria bacterium TMED1]